MHRALYANQDSIGLMPFLSFARSVGVQDTAQFKECISSTARLPEIEDGEADASRAGIRATPTFVLNGIRLRSGADTLLMHDLLPSVLRSNAGAK
jgi:predicted DsbA family dithiol-disulfide isomerase